MLQEITIPTFENSAGTRQRINLTFELYGPALHTAPVVLVNHALTGNSQVIGEKGWWKELVGPSKCIDTRYYTVLCFNMPGNGFDGKKENLLYNYTEFTLHDIARIYAEVLEKLKIDKIFAAIGGSIGGALAWELAALRPELIKKLIPVATDYKATEWVLAQCSVQDQILNNSVCPVHDARMHAMTFYRTPGSLKEKFGRRENSTGGENGVQEWLLHHGEKLESRFDPAAYKLMNHLLTTIDISRGTGKYIEVAAQIASDIHLVTIDSDFFFLARENWETYAELASHKDNLSIHEIKSVHGHDAFLIEYAQLQKILKPIFEQKKPKNENNKYSAVWNG